MYWVRPEWSKYFDTTWEPGDNDVLIYGAILIPRYCAFLQSKPAASITPGLEVFVQEVIAAMITEPWFKLYYFPLN